MRFGSRLSGVVLPTIFLLGVLLLAVMAFLSAWPDMEASVFDAATTLVADDPLQSLDCPIMMSTGETVQVKAGFENKTDRPVSFLVRTRISSGFVTLVRQDSQQVKLAPGEVRELSWPVAAEDAVYGRFVMARVLATRSAGQPARESSCGILVVGMRGIGGQWVFAAGVVLGALLMLIGAGGWWRQRRPLDGRELAIARRGGLLAVVVAASLLTGVLNLWLPSHLLLVAALLVCFVLLEQAYIPKD